MDTCHVLHETSLPNPFLHTSQEEIFLGERMFSNHDHWFHPSSSDAKSSQQAWLIVFMVKELEQLHKLQTHKCTSLQFSGVETYHHFSINNR